MDKEKKAIERIKFASEMSLRIYELPLICTYSGGKDSDVLLELFKRSDILFEVQHNLTTVDAPQTTYHVREVFKKLEEEGIKTNITLPMYKGKRVSMWTLIPQKGTPPTRIMRYCCQILKEQNGKNRFISTGVRKSESVKRQSREEIEAKTNLKKDSIKLTINEVMLDDNTEIRKLIEHCKMKGKMTVNPIIDWSDRDIWGFIRSENIKTNLLYECGYTRVGCVGCPMGGRKNMLKQFADFPTYKRAYIHAFDKMVKAKKTPWASGEEVFDWWIQDPNIKGQLNLFEYLKEDKKW